MRMSFNRFQTILKGDVLIKMKKNVGMLSLLLLVAMIFISAFAAPSDAANKPEHKWKLGIPWSRPAVNENLELFCKLVGEYTDGRIEVKYYPDGQLGTHDEMFHAVRRGDVTIGLFSAYVNLIPGGMINWMPWSTENWDAAKILYKHGEGIIWKATEVAYNEVGCHQLFNVMYGSYGVGSKIRPIRTPKDFDGLRFRVSASLASVMVFENITKNAGVNMTFETIPWADLYNALSKGVVDTIWSMWPSLIDERHGEVIRYYSDLNWTWDCNNMVINKKIWDELPQDLKDAVHKAAMIAEEKQFEKQKSIENDYIEKVRNIPGFTLVHLTPEERAEFRKMSDMPKIWDELAKPWLEKAFPGENMQEKMLEEIDRVHREVEEARSKKQ